MVCGIGKECRDERDEERKEEGKKRGKKKGKKKGVKKGKKTGGNPGKTPGKNPGKNKDRRWERRTAAMDLSTCQESEARTLTVSANGPPQRHWCDSANWQTQNKTPRV